MPSLSLRTRLAARLHAHVQRGTALPSVALGFDGFVDEMIQPVAQRHDLATFTPIPTIASFGALISQAAGHSRLREVVVNAVHPGGCAINMGDGLAALGVPVDVFATLGQPPHPAFTETITRFRSAHSWGRAPGRTLAFEFQDGKLMFSSVAQLAEFTPHLVAGFLAEGAYLAACRAAPLIALTDWTLYPHMTAVWHLLQREVYAHLTHRPRFLIDLVDPTARSTADILAMLATLPAFEPIGPVTLGLNGNEARVLARALGLATAPAEDPPSTLDLAAALRVHLGLTEVVVHTTKFAVVAGLAGAATQSGPYCAHPQKSTGAGDRFNAGYALACLLDLPPGERLACACAASGLFVRLARSPTLAEVITYLTSSDWPDSSAPHQPAPPGPQTRTEPPRTESDAL